MRSAMATPKTPTQLLLTRIPDSWAWMRPDLVIRLLPFTAAFVIAYSAYGVYHRLGRWTWSAAFATGLVGIRLGLAYGLLPGPLSLVGVSLAHIAVTCGFLGPGQYLLRRWRLVLTWRRRTA